MAAGVGMLLRISFPCSVGKQKFAVNYFRDLLVAPQIELPIFASFKRIIIGGTDVLFTTDKLEDPLA